MRAALLMIVMALSASAHPSTFARLQPDVVCVEPDIEFPVACDDEE